MISTQLDTIKELMEYGVPKEHLAEANEFLEEFENDIVALNLLHSFYSFLPDGIEDWIRELRIINKKEGLFLICAVTARNEYLYLVNQERAEFLGQLKEGIYDTEVLDFFGYTAAERIENITKDLTSHPLYSPAYENEELCPVCTTANGEYHTLGCPVEVCPWCGGQLTNCNCRFTVLEKSRISSEQDLRTFEEKLSKKGRIAYDSISQRPAYPSQE
ncbi:MAG: hypothetical protein H8E41_04725 [Desulfobulbaceae bacterium]|uniref:Uncharacterized protein n=1 Tax=Candidatus Desulfobia pelagia TaxID=2841692 RepID=A0A8J6NCQ2_9BACT|nr:hypothetical protein [Candidatus Desulfobia pelagia]